MLSHVANYHPMHRQRKENFVTLLSIPVAASEAAVPMTGRVLPPDWRGWRAYVNVVQREDRSRPQKLDEAITKSGAGFQNRLS